MNNVRFTTVLQYGGELAEVSFDIERYAIVMKSTGATAATPTPAAEGAETTAVQ